MIDTIECGIVLVGSEVKTRRNGKVTLDEAYGSVNRGEVWLHNCDIPEYTQANQFNHETKRKRKLLLHRREIEKFASRAFEKGLTLVPLKLYFKRGKAKVLLGICRPTNSIALSSFAATSTKSWPRNARCSSTAARTRTSRTTPR